MPEEKKSDESDFEPELDYKIENVVATVLINASAQIYFVALVVQLLAQKR